MIAVLLFNLILVQ